MLRYLLLAAALLALGASGSEQQMLVGPDALAAGDSNTPHIEMMIAAHPTDPSKLIAASIVQMNSRYETRVYISNDGGGSWTTGEPGASDSGDPQVAYGPEGTAYYAFLRLATHGAHLDVYRSSDQGQTWNGADLGMSYDHPQMTVDWTSSHYRGNVYIGVLYGKYPEYTVGVFRSTDDGATFQGPFQAADVNDGHHGINEITPVVLSDGTLVLFYEGFGLDAATRNTDRGSFFEVQSKDGGRTFGAPIKINDEIFGPHAQMMARQDAGDFAIQGFPQFAVDSSSGLYRDRIYGVWPDRRSGAQRVLLTYSANRGATWNTPVQISPNSDAAVEQYQPSIAVNKDGALAVTWFETRSGSGSYRENATLSLNGGQTFLPTRIISSASSYPRGGLNTVFSVGDSYGSAGSPLPTNDIQLGFVSAVNRWPDGGDYMGLTSDAAGSFHAFWADARSGTFEPWTATFVAGTPAATPPVHPADVTKDIRLVFSLVSQDVPHRLYAYDVRIRNTSAHTIYGPLTVRVVGVQSPYDLQSGMARAIDIPVILNAENGKRGIGAIFDYSNALGDFHALPPGGSSSAQLWKIQASDIAAPSIVVNVQGSVSQ